MREIKTKPEGGKPKLLERATRMPKAAMKGIIIATRAVGMLNWIRIALASRYRNTISPLLLEFLMISSFSAGTKLVFPRAPLLNFV